MKNIFTTISALFFLAGSISLNVYLNNGDQHQQVVVMDHVISPDAGYFWSGQTGTLPSHECNCEKPTEGRHVGNSQLTTVRKASLRDIAVAHVSHAVPTFPSPNAFVKAPVRHVAYSNGRATVPLHLLNCVWLI